MVELHFLEQKVKIDKGELISYTVEGYECMHQKGSLGWRNSDTEMFPIIGPVNTANYTVQTPIGEAKQDQHGLLRELSYELVSQENQIVIFKKTYKANTKISNSKYPAKSTQELLSWPYDFSFCKRFEITKEGLKVSFTIEGEEGMPFMLGYHPAFKLNSKKTVINSDEKSITLDEIKEAGSNAYPVQNCEDILLKDGKEVHIKTAGFNHFMLWTEVDNMLCIEPITFYPYAVSQNNLAEGFQFLEKKPKEFSVLIAVK